MYGYRGAWRTKVLIAVLFTAVVTTSGTLLQSAIRQSVRRGGSLFPRGSPTSPPRGAHGISASPRVTRLCVRVSKARGRTRAHAGETGGRHARVRVCHGRAPVCGGVRYFRAARRVRGPVSCGRCVRRRAGARALAPEPSVGAGWRSVCGPAGCPPCRRRYAPARHARGTCLYEPIPTSSGWIASAAHKLWSPGSSGLSRSPMLGAASRGLKGRSRPLSLL